MSVSIEGHGACRHHVDDELSALAQTSVDRPDLTFAFGDPIPRLDGRELLRPVQVGRSGYQARHSDWEYHVTHLGEGQLSVRLRPVPAGRPLHRRPIPAWARRAYHWNYLLPEEDRVKNFMYNVFDYLTQVAQLPLGQTYLHASSFAFNGRGIAIAAWGGTGKTSALLKFVSEHGGRFLSDDLGVIDEAGRLHRSPKRLQVYAYNVVGEPRLEARLMQGRTRLDRAAWRMSARLRGIERTRRRVSAESLFGVNSVAETMPLTDLFLAERTSAEELRSRPIEPETAAARMTWTMLHELSPFPTISTAIHSSTTASIIPTMTEMYDATYSVLSRALQGAELCAVEIPEAAGPAEIAGYLRQILDDRGHPARSASGAG